MLTPEKMKAVEVMVLDGRLVLPPGINWAGARQEFIEHVVVGLGLGTGSKSVKCKP